MPHRQQLPDEDVKVFSRDQLAGVLAMAPERHQPLFELLAATGLRISEAIALQRLHLQLDQDEPEVCIRRAIVRDRIVPPRASTAAARSGYLRRSRRGCAPILPPSPIKTRPPSPSPAKPEARSTPASSSAAS